MKDRIIRFLTDLDQALAPRTGDGKLDLYHIGRSALVWKYGFVAATEDVDVVSPRGDSTLMREAIALFGRGTPKAREHGLYLEEVPPGLPPIWGGCYNRATEADEKWRTIRLFHLEAHDMAVTKLTRFSRKDREDIQQMCDFGLLDADVLAERVSGAWFFAHDKDEDPKREAASANLLAVQKYMREGVW